MIHPQELNLNDRKAASRLAILIAPPCPRPSSDTDRQRGHELHRVDGLRAAQSLRRPGLRRARHDEHQQRRRVRLLHGRVRRPAGLPLLLGLDPRPQALADGHNLPVVRPVRRRGLRRRVRSAPGGRQARRPTGNRPDPPGQLLQRQPGDGRPERLHRRQAHSDPGDRGGRLVQAHPGQHAAPEEPVRQHRGGGRGRGAGGLQRRQAGHGVLHGPLGLRRLEQPQLRDRGDKGPVEEPAAVHHDRHTPGDALLRPHQRLLSRGHVAPRDDRQRGRRRGKITTLCLLLCRACDDDGHSARGDVVPLVRYNMAFFSFSLYYLSLFIF